MLSTDKQLYQCTAFDNIAKAAALFSEHEEVLAGGYQDEMMQFIVQSILKPTDGGTRVIKNKAFTERENQILEFERQAMIRDGFVQYQGRWIEKDYCVETQTGWIPKIEFVCDHLGNETVTNILMEKFGKGITFSKEFSLGYKSWLNETVDSIIRGT